MTRWPCGWCRRFTETVMVRVGLLRPYVVYLCKPCQEWSGLEEKI